MTDRPHPIDVEVGTRVRDRRKAMGLSQTDLARRIGLTFQQVQKYENGMNRISVSRLWMIGQALDVSVESFVAHMSAGNDSEADAGAADDSERLVKAWRNIRSPIHRSAVVNLVESLARSRKPRAG